MNNKTIWKIKNAIYDFNNFSNNLCYQQRLKHTKNYETAYYDPFYVNIEIKLFGVKPIMTRMLKEMFNCE